MAACLQGGRIPVGPLWIGGAGPGRSSASVAIVMTLASLCVVSPRIQKRGGLRKYIEEQVPPQTGGIVKGLQSLDFHSGSGGVYAGTDRLILGGFFPCFLPPETPKGFRRKAVILCTNKVFQQPPHSAL